MMHFAAKVVAFVHEVDELLKFMLVMKNTLWHQQ